MNKATAKISADAALKADVLWRNGKIRTLDPTQPRTECVATRGGRILAVGSEAALSAFVGPGTRVHDLGGRFVMPGLIDAHTHALMGAKRDLFDVYVGFAASTPALIEATRARAAATAAGEWIFGGPWRAEQIAQLGMTPRAALDAVSTDHPIALTDIAQHSIWANSAALRLAGIDRTTPDPVGGEIVRGDDGEPTGLLHEAASGAMRLLCALDPERMVQTAVAGAGTLLGYGVTGFKEPASLEPELAALQEADRRGQLPIRVTCCIARESPFAPTGPSLDEMIRWRRDYASANVSPTGGKLFLDGVAPSHTASFLEPYATPGYDAASHDPEATLRLPPEEIAAEVIAMDAAGFTVKMHAVGDGAVRAGLDAIEAARRTNGFSGLRHEIAHCTFVDPADMPRFAALQAVAELSPKIWFPNPVTASQRHFLGEARAAGACPIGDLLRAGAEVAYGSDWPAASPDPNPWTGLAGMITRRDPTGRHDGVLGAEQAVTLDQALEIFVTNGARAQGREASAGRLRAGFDADFIVLDRALDEVDPMDIAETRAQSVVVAGQEVAGL